MNEYNKWERRMKKEIEFLFSNPGEELQLCLVAQGYTNLLFQRLMFITGSGFPAIRIIKKLEEEIK